MLQNISDFKNNYDLLPIFLAVIVIDFIVILISKNTTFFGNQINVWYDKLGITAVLLDVFIIIIGLLITRFIFTYFSLTFSPIKFIIVALIVQIIHDMLLYKLFIENHKGGNLILEIYKEYAKENGPKIIVADSLMVIGSCLLAMYFKSIPSYNNIFGLILAIYLIPYYVYKK
jgi:uncharacterized protein YacL